MRFTVDVIAGLAVGSGIDTLESGEDTIYALLDKVLSRRQLAEREVRSLAPDPAAFGFDSVSGAEQRGARWASDAGSSQTTPAIVGGLRETRAQPMHP